MDIDKPHINKCQSINVWWEMLIIKWCRLSFLPCSRVSMGSQIITNGVYEIRDWQIDFLTLMAHHSKPG